MGNILGLFPGKRYAWTRGICIVYSRGTGIACVCEWPEEQCSSKQKLETGLPVWDPIADQACSMQALHSVLSYSLGPRNGFSLLLSN